MMTPEEARHENAKVDAGIDILELACDEALEAVYHYHRGDNPHADDRRFDVLALLITVYCRRAHAIGCAPQEMLETFWPPDATWVEGPDDAQVKQTRR